MSAHQPHLLMEAYQSVYAPKEEIYESDEYDYVVDFLLDEGYAQSVEEADALIEQLSDEEIYDILDEVRGGGFIPGSGTTYAGDYTWFPTGERDNRSSARKKYDKFVRLLHADMPPKEAWAKAGVRNPRPRGTQPTVDRTPEGTESGLAMSPKARAEGRVKSLERKGLTKQANTLRAKIDANRRLNMEDSADFYDLVLEHLINEGYADSEDSALKIMSNMSDEWVESIIEGLKFIPLTADQEDDIEARLRRVYNLADRYNRKGASIKRNADFFEKLGVPHEFNPGLKQAVRHTNWAIKNKLLHPQTRKPIGLFKPELVQRATDNMILSSVHRSAGMEHKKNQEKARLRELESE